MSSKVLIPPFQSQWCQFINNYNFGNSCSGMDSYHICTKTVYSVRIKYFKSWLDTYLENREAIDLES